MIIKFNCDGMTRKVLKDDEAVVAVRQDSGVDVVRIVMEQSTFNNLTLSGATAKFLYLDETETVKSYDANVTADGTVYTADWPLGDDVSDEAGVVTFSVRIAKDSQKWYSLEGKFNVADTINDTED